MPRWMITIVGLTAGMAAVAYATAYALHRPPPVMFGLYSALALVFMLLVGLIALIGYIVALARRGEQEPLSHVGAAVKSKLAPSWLVNHVVPVFATFSMMGAFGSMKVMLPLVVPFYADPALIKLERVLFFTDPWRITHFLFGWATPAIDIVYSTFWVPVTLVTMTLVGLLASDESRRRFFLTFYAIWIGVGFVMAYALSSAGPCFLQLAGLQPFPIPMADAPLSGEEQAFLLNGFLNEGIGRGITAMPSVHVGMALLLLLFARGWGKPLAALFFSIIAIGSVHLGWHYASDGIVSCVFTWFFWRATAASGDRVEARRRVQV